MTGPDRRSPMPMVKLASSVAERETIGAQAEH